MPAIGCEVIEVAGGNDAPIERQKLERAIDSLCPYCDRSGILSATLMRSEGGEAWQTVTCGSCRKVWHEIYTMTRIEEVTPT